MPAYNGAKTLKNIKGLIEMPRKEVINSAKLSPGRAPLSQATRFGGLVFVQGCTGRHPTSGEVGKDIKEQTRFTLDRIKIILEEAGTSLDNVLTNTCYLAHLDSTAHHQSLTPDIQEACLGLSG